VVAALLSATPSVQLVGDLQPFDRDWSAADLAGYSVAVVVARREDSFLWRTVMGIARPPSALPVIVVGPEELRTTAFLTGAEDWMPLKLYDAGQRAQLIRSIHNAVIRRRVAGGLPTHGHLHGLVTGIAHEVNNPLTVIHADLEDARERLADICAAQTDPDVTEELTEMLEMLAEDQCAAQRIGSLTRGLQNLARLADTVPSALHTGPAVRRVLRRLREANPMAPDPEVVGRTEWRVHGSIHGFEEALFNVLQNATHAQARRAPNQPVEIAFIDSPDQLYVRIRDNGPGIRSDIVGNELAPFVTGREPGEGLGLGLTFAALAVRRAGGEISIHARAGGGTEARLQLLHARRPAMEMLYDEESEVAAR
jgi:signal transduction histidine kinase